MKIIFVTNDISFYGASRSLKSLLSEIQNDNNFEINLIIPKRLFGRHNLNDISEWFSVKPENIKEFSLPFYNNYKGNNISIFPYIYTFLSKFHSRKLNKYLKKHNPDYIHLNSLTLIDLASKKYNYVLHVREILKKNNNLNYLQRKINSLNKIIFIDEATKYAFNFLKIKKNIILNNPFNMLHLSEIDYTYALEKYLNLKTSNKIIVSLIGKIHPEKGSEFIINAFNKLKRKDILLMVMGSGESSYYSYLKSIVSENILFINESPDVDPLYKISDYIIRGENYPCIGRTTFEGLYSGISVILPGDLNFYMNNITDFEYFKNNILLYTPRNSDSLTQVIENLTQIKYENRIYKSNLNKYISEFKHFLIND
jgi:hypothetical protein